MRILVTGGFGFIGSALIKKLLSNPNNKILNIDAEMSQSMPESLNDFRNYNNYNHIKENINNYFQIEKIFNRFDPESIFHLAAESHVDRSIASPESFIKTNIIGTHNLLEITKKFISNNSKINNFKFIHVSTDEVYGSLDHESLSFKEGDAYAPNSPYSASKASSDLLVRAWNKSFKLPTIITHCSNNYGPWQFPEKLIPLIIHNALINKYLPIYGEGSNLVISTPDDASVIFQLVEDYFAAQVGEEDEDV